MTSVNRYCTHSRHPEEPRILGGVSKDGLQALVAHPSRLAVKDGEHLRMTVVAFGQGTKRRPA
jgi:hypothetical protein